ncbi:MAG: S41 family peptidase [Bacteriovoracaceae bacterium]|nr:S41 family peptidase [Bacteriovoracaceae bacterium]
MKKVVLRGLQIALVCLGISFLGIITGFEASRSVLAVSNSRFEQLELFNKILFLIESQYYRPVETEKLMQGAIKGMMETLDPHSAYLPKEVFDKMQDDTSGEFGGLGIEVTEKDGIFYVIAPMDDSPAFKKDLRPGDKILEIDGEQLLGVDLQEAVAKMRGKPGSSVTLGIHREGFKEIKQITFKREIIRVPPVKSELVGQNYIFVRLTSFQKRSAASIESALKKYQKESQSKGGIKGIILDLRSNPGGLLDEAVAVSSLFLKEGIVVSTESRDMQNKDIHYVLKTGYKDTETPMIVLINGASASASEIVAGALQDHARAIVMGAASFGKGSVQTVAKIDKNNGVKLTIAQYMTPKNRKIQAIGIIPDIELDEADALWTQRHKTSQLYVREKDLKNHLTATVETENERKIRIKKEKLERTAKIKAYQEQSKEREKEKEDVVVSPQKYQAENDYQVIQAVNFLKGLAILQKKGL